jgi:hypothetical protein
MHRMNFHRMAVGVFLVCLGMVAGALLSPPRAAWGEVQQQPPPQAFKSGDQLSLPILRDIATTLHQIDGRLSRLETVFKELTTPRPQANGN